MPARALSPIVVALACLSPIIGAQDILHYKFESGGGGTEINYGDPAPGIPRLGQVVPDSGLQASQAWGSGALGTGGLAAGPFTPTNGFELDTGWDDVLGTGVDVTLACFFKLNYAIPNTEIVFLCRAAGNGPCIRMSMNGQPGSVGHLTFHWQSAGSGSTTTLQQNLMAPAVANWIHVAVVIDRTNVGGCQSATTQWFVNGVPQLTQFSGSCWNNIEGSSLNTFRFGNKDEAYFAYDDWRLYLRAASAGEILQWATMDQAIDAPFGDGCAPFGQPVLLWGSGGNPTIGNAAYKLTVYGLPGSSVILGVGFSDTTYSGTPLPTNLGAFVAALAGCQLRVSPDFLIAMTVPADGTVDLPLPIPTGTGLAGMDAYAQAVLYSSVTGSWSSTNAWGMHLGY